MKRVMSVKEITIDVPKELLLKDRFAPKKAIASIIHSMDTKKEGLRNMFYNSFAWGKYNTMLYYGIDFIDVINPMKQKRASLILHFDVLKGD